MNSFVLAAALSKSYPRLSTECCQNLAAQLDAAMRDGLAEAKRNGVDPHDALEFIAIKVGVLPWVCRKLIELRKQKGLSQADVGKAAGWSAAKQSRIETGASSISPSDLAALLECYAVTDEAFIGHLRREAGALRRTRLNKP